MLLCFFLPYHIPRFVEWLSLFHFSLKSLSSKTVLMDTTDVATRVRSCFRADFSKFGISEFSRHNLSVRFFINRNCAVTHNQWATHKSPARGVPSIPTSWSFDLSSKKVCHREKVMAIGDSPSFSTKTKYAARYHFGLIYGHTYKPNW
jgi:hypothetical protein